MIDLASGIPESFPQPERFQMRMIHSSDPLSSLPIMFISSISTWSDIIAVDNAMGFLGF